MRPPSAATALDPVTRPLSIVERTHSGGGPHRRLVGDPRSRDSVRVASLASRKVGWCIGLERTTSRANEPPGPYARISSDRERRRLRVQQELHIARMLRSLARQTMDLSEVIVVDDGSTDATRLIAECEAVDVISVPHRGPAVGRNLGARRASADVLVFLDGDMECAPAFVGAARGPITEGSAVGSFTRGLRSQPGEPVGVSLRCDAPAAKRAPAAS